MMLILFLRSTRERKSTFRLYIIIRDTSKEEMRNSLFSFGCTSGRQPEVKTICFTGNGQTVTREVETFTWEKPDYVDKVKQVFGL